MQDFGSSEYIPTRSTKTAPKVAYNPMQFVKTGPTKLAQTAQEQLKKAEEVKKIRETKKDDQEDWQSVRVITTHLSNYNLTLDCFNFKIEFGRMEIESTEATGARD